MRRPAHLAIAIEHGRLLALAASTAGGRVRIRTSLCIDIPGRIDPNDTAAFGAWLRERLREAGLAADARRGAVFAVGRGEVVLKRLTFPAGTTSTDLPDMVRLQMARQMTVSGESAAIDFAPLEAGEGADRVEVLAAALSEDRLAWRREVARAAGLRLMRVSLGSMGAAALVGPAAQRRNGGTLGVSLSWGSCEFVVVEGGRLVFARATDLDRAQADDDPDGFAEQVAVEARRTWMSYRVTHESIEIEAVAVIGGDPLAQRVAERCEHALQMTAEPAPLPEFIDAPDISEADRAAFGPLAGLLAEPVTAAGGIDFLHPRQPPDRQEQVRKRILVAALVLIVVVGGYVTYTRTALRALHNRLAEAENATDTARTSYIEHMRRRAKVDHAEQWRNTAPDWLSHLDYLTDALPRGEVMLDSITARWEPGLTYDRPEGGGGKFWYVDGQWVSRPRGSLRLSGRADRRELADGVRDSLVDDPIYTLATRGPDVPDRFDWTLTTPVAAPSRDRPTGVEFGPEEGAIR